MRPINTVTAVLVVPFVLSGCLPASGDKTGNPRPSNTLELASSDGPAGLSAPGVAYFVDQVAAVSGGQLRISVQSNWKGGDDEPRVIRDVAAGEAALGWSGTRAFDRVGIDDFEPLHAPFLVSTYPAEAAVVTAPVAREMLDGLASHGITGLGLLADELRMTASATRPVLVPGDFKALAFGTFDSAVQTSALQFLGSRPKTMARPNGSAIEGLDALETMWWTYDHNHQRDQMPFVSRNVVLWPRTVAIFANTQILGNLNGDEQRWLAEAADRAATWSALHAQDEQATEIEQACEDGARIATASPIQLDRLRDAAEPFYAALRNDRQLATTMRSIEAAVAGAPSATLSPLPSGCAYVPGEQFPVGGKVKTLTGPGRPGDLPPGTYRYAVTLDELIAHGASSLDAQANAGVWTWTLGDGRWNFKFQPFQKVPPGYLQDHCAGYYDVVGHHLEYTTVTEYPSGECAPPTWAGSWSRTDGGLEMSHIIDGKLDYLFGGKHWERISGPE